MEVFAATDTVQYLSSNPSLLTHDGLVIAILQGRKVPYGGKIIIQATLTPPNEGGILTR
jgi:hypothetical protein